MNFTAFMTVVMVMTNVKNKDMMFALVTDMVTAMVMTNVKSKDMMFALVTDMVMAKEKLVSAATTLMIKASLGKTVMVAAAATLITITPRHRGAGANRLMLLDNTSYVSCQSWC